MVSSTNALVLSSLKYGDSSLIVRMYTSKFGLQSYMLKGVLARKKGSFKAGHFQPLTQLEIVASTSKEGKLGYLREATISVPYQTLHSDIRKSTIALFLSEVLSVSIGESEPDTIFFDYLSSAFQWLDHHDRIANFHIRFLIGLTRHLGFFPDLTHQDAPYFDLYEGAFVSETPLNPVIQGQQLEFLISFLNTGFDEIADIKLNGQQRKDLLKVLIKYFELHLPAFREPRSLEVLDTVFA